MSSASQNTQPKPPRVIDSQSILAGQTQVIIQHGDTQYRLGVTKENKLILTK